jgi:uncharacterized DUF497 family protein
MKSLKFEWDLAKALSNIKKHGVSFEEARASTKNEERQYKEFLP